MSFSDSSGDSKSQQQATTDPYAPTVPVLGSLISQISGLDQGAGTLNPTQTGAINTLESEAGNPWAPQIGKVADEAFGVQSQAPVASDAYKTLQQQLTPVANGSQMDIANNPEVQSLLATIRSDVGNQVNQQFAGAGRSGSGMNQQTLARGISQGEASPLLGLYTTEQGMQQGAAGTLYNAGQGTAANTQNLNTNAVQTNAAGADISNAAVAANQLAPTQVLQDEAAKLGIPAAQLQQIASMLFPAAGLGKTTTGTGTSSTDSTTMGVNGKDIGSMLSGVASVLPLLL